MPPYEGPNAPYLLANTRTDDTVSAGTHETDHNQAANAITDILAVVSAPLPPAPFYFPWQFPVESYGAVGDGVADDTAAIIAAHDAAVAYAQAHHGYCEVIFRPTVYLANQAPSGGASGKCNAILPIDPVAQTAQKVICVWKGTAEQGALYHWLQTTPQLAGAVIRTTVAAGTTPVHGNEAAIVGTGNPHNGFGIGGVWNNMHFVIDGVGLAAPQNPQICGWDLRGMAEVTCKSSSVLAVSTVTGAPTIPDNTSGLWAWGLRMPGVNNNAICDIDTLSVEGFTYGLVFEEHIRCSTLRVVNCFDGMAAWNEGVCHDNHFDMVVAENCHQLVVMAGDQNHIEIRVLDIEPGDGHVINDTIGDCAGFIGISANGTGAQINDNILNNAALGPIGYGPGLKIINNLLGGGPQGAPAFPASAAALLNPFWRDCQVTITAGAAAVTVAVGGVTQGVVPANGVCGFAVPSGATITATYAPGAPSWKWVSL